MNRFSTFFIVCTFLFASLTAMNDPKQYERNFKYWKMHCDACLNYPTLMSPLTLTELLNELVSFRKAHTQGFLSKQETWVETEEGVAAMPSTDFFSGDSFEPYLQKVNITDNTVLIQGDLHGDIESANKLIEFMVEKKFSDPKNPFRIIDPKFKIVFLGDYTDRGKFGAEVLYIVSRLKRTNPNQFFASLGNHESIQMNEKYGLAKELSDKFGKEHVPEILDQVKKMYNFLPVALILQSGTDALYGYHGGPELGVQKEYIHKLLNAPGENRCILLNQLMRKTRADNTASNYQECYTNIRKNFPEELQNFNPALKGNPKIHIGYLWNDFKFTTDDDPEEQLEFDDNRGFTFPAGLTRYLLEEESTPTYRMRGILRAHQHCPKTLKRILNLDGKSEPEDAGVAKLWLPEGTIQPAGKLWDGIVCTFCVAPNTGYDQPGLTHNHVGLLQTAPNFADWRLEMHRIPAGKKS